MRLSTTSVYILSSIAISDAFIPTDLSPSTIADASSTVVAYWSPITTLPPQPIPSSGEHLELRAAPVAPAPAAPAAPAAQQPNAAAPAAGATTAAVAPAAQQTKAAAAAAAAAAEATKAAAAQAAAASKAAAVPAAAAPAVGVGGAGAAPAAAQPAATNPGQVPTVTNYQGTTWINGVPKQVAIVYTQMFSSVPSPGPSPINGAIGLGTITGPVGVAKTGNAKRGAASTNGREGLDTLVAGMVFMILGATMMWV